MAAYKFETDRLHVRPLRDDDQAFFSRLYGDPQTMRFIAPPLTTEQAVDLFEKTLSRMHRPSPGGFSLVIVEKNSMKKMGICGTSRFEEETGCIEAGILMMPYAQSRGFGKEAMQAMMARIFSGSVVNQIRVRFSAENRVVRAMNVSLGFSPQLEEGKSPQESVTRTWSIRRSSWCARTNNQLKSTGGRIQMSNVIDFMEKMGQDSQLRHAAKSDLQAALECTSMDPELMAAILAGDQRQLEILLGQSNVCCAFMPSKEDEEDDESPAKQDDEIVFHSMVRVSASAG